MKRIWFNFFRILSCLCLFFTVTHSLNAQEVIRPALPKKIVLKIVRAIPDGFETYSLTNHNGREMVLVCAQNRVYENNPNAFIEYRNFFNEIAGQFKIEKNLVCKDMAKFIEQAHHGIDQTRPFVISLNVEKMSVEKIVYPMINPLADKGDINDLYPKKQKLDFPKPEFNYLK